ncbi:uncharacterized protein LOC128223362 [Mya arenaria]|uniref:uncharacterized protein LOC128223362 n=1 Tax=Mya arenaria TaxID=6604 RepID=UPI0022E8AA9E|nr:uncharacterized protein LOC128223362 [Mya arenaria]
MGGTHSKKVKNKSKSAKHMVPFLDVEVYKHIDDTCSFSGITFLKDGRIAIADYLGHYVKFYDWKMLKLLDSVELATPPYGICTSSICESYLYVTMPFEHKVLHFKVKDDRLDLVKHISTEGRCYGIASFKDGIAVGLRVEKHSWRVEILDYAGSVLKVFKDDDHGRDLFGYADYLTVDPDGSRLYVSDGVQNSVICLNLQDSTMVSIKEMFRYTDSHLSIPKGLTLDCEANLYVIGCESNNVHKISSTGDKIGVVLGHREQLDKPMGIVYDNYEKKLFVTEGSRKVMVFVDG